MYLLFVMFIAVIGGAIPALLSAVAAFLLLNWYFTPPIHTFTISEGRPCSRLAELSHRCGCHQRAARPCDPAARPSLSCSRRSEGARADGGHRLAGSRAAAEAGPRAGGQLPARRSGHLHPRRRPVAARGRWPVRSRPSGPTTPSDCFRCRMARCWRGRARSSGRRIASCWGRSPRRWRSPSKAGGSKPKRPARRRWPRPTSSGQHCWRP